MAGYENGLADDGKNKFAVHTTETPPLNKMDFMFFLIGCKEFNKPLKDVGGVACQCGRCHNQLAYAVRVINTVTLFFIPVLPFYFGKKLKCNICGATGNLDGHTIDLLKKGQPVAILG